MLPPLTEPERRADDPLRHHGKCMRSAIYQVRPRGATRAVAFASWVLLALLAPSRATARTRPADVAAGARLGLETSRAPAAFAPPGAVGAQRFHPVAAPPHARRAGASSRRRGTGRRRAGRERAAPQRSARWRGNSRQARSPRTARPARDPLVRARRRSPARAARHPTPAGSRPGARRRPAARRRARRRGRRKRPRPGRARRSRRPGAHVPLPQPSPSPRARPCPRGRRLARDTSLRCPAVSRAGPGATRGART